MSKKSKKGAAQPSDPSGKKRKPGNQGKFSAKRVEFLEQHLSRYLEADTARLTKSFFTEIISTYWEKFNWCFKPLEEVPNDWTRPDGNDNDLSEEEMSLKSKQMKEVPGVSVYLLLIIFGSTNILFSK